jgi:hypothetical protein
MAISKFYIYLFDEFLGRLIHEKIYCTISVETTGNSVNTVLRRK